jgi:hypothetical protein
MGAPSPLIEYSHSTRHSLRLRRSTTRGCSSRCSCSTSSRGRSACATPPPARCAACWCARARAPRHADAVRCSRASEPVHRAGGVCWCVCVWAWGVCVGAGQAKDSRIPSEHTAQFELSDANDHRLAIDIYEGEAEVRRTDMARVCARASVCVCFRRLRRTASCAARLALRHSRALATQGGERGGGRGDQSAVRAGRGWGPSGLCTHSLRRRNMWHGHAAERGARRWQRTTCTLVKPTSCSLAG